MTAVAVIIPVKNEADSIRRQVEALLTLGYFVVVSDGGSTDGTVGQVAESPRVKCIVRKPGHSDGIGPSILRGMVYAHFELGAGRVVVMDAQSHSPDDVLRLLERDDDVVIGSRFLSQSVYHGRPARRLMSRAVATACSQKTGVWISDWTSGFRAYSPRAVREILSSGFKTTMHSWQLEVLYGLLVRHKHYNKEPLSFAECPIHYVAGRSSMSPRIALAAFSVWLGMKHAN